MHELAHIICGHEMREKHIGVELPLLRDYEPVHEAEANCLGGCLQLPREALLWALGDQNMTKEDISDYYEASIQMVRKRINETGVTNQLRNRRRK